MKNNTLIKAMTATERREYFDLLWRILAVANYTVAVQYCVFNNHFEVIFTYTGEYFDPLVVENYGEPLYSTDALTCIAGNGVNKLTDALKFAPPTYAYTAIDGACSLKLCVPLTDPYPNTVQTFVNINVGQMIHLQQLDFIRFSFPTMEGFGADRGVSYWLDFFTEFLLNISLYNIDEHYPDVFLKRWVDNEYSVDELRKIVLTGIDRFVCNPFLNSTTVQNLYTLAREGFRLQINGEWVG